MTETITRPRRTYTILITDDDPSMRETLREIVEPEGFATYLASSGEEAIEIVETKMVHLALLDMHMPSLTGLETLQWLRRIHAWLPAILVTADATNELLRQAFSSNVYSVLPKPVKRQVLVYTVVRALEKVHKEIDRTRTDQPEGGEVA